MGPKMTSFIANWGRNPRFCFRDPQKALPCAEPRRLSFCVKIGARVSAVAFLKNQKKKLSYRRGNARCVVSVEILPIATQR